MDQCVLTLKNNIYEIANLVYQHLMFGKVKPFITKIGRKTYIRANNIIHSKNLRMIIIIIII